MKNSMQYEICLCGDGWGALAALDGISLGFSDVTVVSNDKNVIKKAVSKGYEISKSILDVNAQIYVCAGFTTILNRNFLEANKVINIHYSLLPKYRGLHSTVWSILNNDSFFGLTIHIMNEFIDDGPIIHQYKFRNCGQNSREVMEECNRYIAVNLFEIVSDFLNGKIQPIVQKKTEATWVCKRNLDDCLIDFNQSVEFLTLFFRALVDPYPLPRLKTKKCLVEVTKFELVVSSYYMSNGRVVNIENQKVWIKVNDGFLIVSEVRDCSTKTKLDLCDIFKIGMRLQ